MLYEIYFSPTGGTKKVADAIARAWEEYAETIDLADRAFIPPDFSFGAEDVCLLAVPSYGGRVPEAAAKRAKNLSGGGANAVLICVYGNRAYEDTLIELKDIAEKAGFHCVAAVAAVAEHSIVHQIAAGRPDEEDRKQLLEFGRKIRQRIDGKMVQRLNVPGNRPYRPLHLAVMIPEPGLGCTLCGLCGRKCPVGAISLDNPALIDSQKCISCMRCVAVCPQHTRHIDKTALASLAQRLETACSGRKENELF